MNYYYYLNFKDPVLSEEVAALFVSDPKSEIYKVFNSSFDISTELSFSKVRHLVRTAFPDRYFYLLQARKGALRCNDEPVPCPIPDSAKSIAKPVTGSMDHIVVNVSDLSERASQLVEDGMKYVKLCLTESDDTCPDDILPPCIMVSACESEDDPAETTYDSIDESEYKF